MVFNDLSGMIGPYKLSTPITTLNYTNNDIVISDTDNDGFYFWGIGPKPSSCSSYVPDIADGDDSNPLLGPLDQYGYCENLNPNETEIYDISDRLVNQPSHGLYIISGRNGDGSAVTKKVMLK